MTSDKLLYQEIEKIYSRDEKSKKFITHLIYSYLPIENLTVVDNGAKKLECSISKKALKTLSSAQGDVEFLPALLHKHLLFRLNIETEDVEINSLDKDNIAFTGSNTKTIISLDSYIALIHFVCNSLKTDKHIEWIVRKIEVRPFLNKVLGIKPAPKKSNFSKSYSTTAKVTTLGDLDQFKELQKLFNN